MLRKYRVREGSIADYGRIVIASVLFWGIVLGTAVVAYM